jgi:hypothetical protein
LDATLLSKYENAGWIQIVVQTIWQDVSDGDFVTNMENWKRGSGFIGWQLHICSTASTSLTVSNDYNIEVNHNVLTISKENFD